jgi:hypothetical protein
MSIGVGTLQPKSRIMRPVWLGAVLALVAAVTLGVIVANSDDEPARVTTPTTQVSGTEANTPSELRGGMPAESIGGMPGLVPHIPRRVPAGETPGGTLGINTPTEISGGNADFCHQCR